LHRSGQPTGYAGRFGACRRRPRSTQIADEVQLGRLQAKLPWLGQRGRRRDGQYSRDFDEFARGRQLGGATIVLDSSGGSVNDSIALGRRWRNLGVLTTVGISVQTNTAQGVPASMTPAAYCESMCVFLLLSGKTRYVPETAHVRVHQIWLGDRADDAKAATYSADDLMIVERDIGRLAKYTFDMGGTGDLLSLSLNVPPWEDLHELSREELRLTNLVTTDVLAQPGSPNATPKPVQDRFVSNAAARSTKAAEAMGQTGGVRATAPPGQR
jgi:hypothetical protein